jgi:hypothetical protein
VRGPAPPASRRAEAGRLWCRERGRRLPTIPLQGRVPKTTAAGALEAPLFGLPGLAFHERPPPPFANRRGETEGRPGPGANPPAGTRRRVLFTLIHSTHSPLSRPRARQEARRTEGPTGTENSAASRDRGPSVRIVPRPGFPLSREKRGRVTRPDSRCRLPSTRLGAKRADRQASGPALVRTHQRCETVSRVFLAPGRGETGTLP